MLDFLIPFLAVGLAELGDKTQLAIVCLASKTKNYISLLAGVMLAFIITDGLAIIFGKWIGTLIPLELIKIISGCAFIFFGIIVLLSFREEESKCELKNPFVSGFLIILVSEIGDKTQIASALFPIKYNAWLVFAGVISALAIVSLLAIFLGKFIMKKVKPRVATNISGIMLIVVGIVSLFF